MRTKSDSSSEEEKKIIRITGERIANKRRRLGISQEVLSGEAQISKGNLSMISRKGSSLIRRSSLLLGFTDSST
jgi:hypothetical protein